MSGLERQGFVGLFSEPLAKPRIEEIVSLWIERFGNVEQILGKIGQVLTVKIQSTSDLIWEKDLQFRILHGEQFAWVYLTMDRYIIETSGLVSENASSLCRDVFKNLDGCKEIIDEHNNRRLDELETQGLL